MQEAQGSDHKNKVMKRLPVYKLVISNDLGSDIEVDAVALVEAPAIERNFMAFNDAVRLTFNEERRIVSGPAMLADYPIYRRNDQYGEHYVVFDKEQIQAIANRFLAKGYAKSFNLFHDPAQTTDGVSVLNSFVTDEQMGILPMKGYEDAKDGSWFLSAKINDDAIWKKVKDGEIQGFSVEGMFIYKEADEPNPLLAALELIYNSIPDHV